MILLAHNRNRSTSIAPAGGGAGAPGFPIAERMGETPMPHGLALAG
jgi:hypothetical protein